MSHFIRKWFSTGSKAPVDVNKTDAHHHKLVESCLDSLKQAECLSPGDYYRLYRALMDWSRLDQQQEKPQRFTRRLYLDLLIAHFSEVKKVEEFTPERLAYLLQFTGLTNELARWLVGTFSDLACLFLEEHPSGGELSPSMLHTLLLESPRGGNKCWARQLTMLSIHTNRAELWHNLIPQLTANNFPVLDALVIQCHEPLCVPGGPALDLPILHQLLDFFIYTADSFGAIWPTLKTHITRESQKEVGRFYLHLPLAAPLLYEVLCTMTATFAATIFSLNVVLPCPSLVDSSSSSSFSRVLPFLVRKFAALTVLILKTPSTVTEHYTLLQLLGPVAQLDKLVSLKMRLHSYKQLPSAGANIPDAELKLPHLTYVTITIQEVRHDSFHTPTIVGLFPAAVRPVGVCFTHCDVCGDIGSKLANHYSQAPRPEDFNHCWGKVIVDAREGDIKYIMYLALDY